MSRFLETKFIISTLTIAIIYVAITIYLMNVSLLKSTLLGSFTLSYKFNLLIALLGGIWTAMSRFGLSMLVLAALLTGANLTLIVQRITSLNSSGKLHFMAGGSSLLGFIGSGCAACGLPVLALLGLSGSVIYLPYRGQEILILAVGLLILSFYLMIKSDAKEKICKIN